MSDKVVNLDEIRECITDEQRKKLSEALEKIMLKYSTCGNNYFDGVNDGLNHAYKMINAIDDDYNATDNINDNVE